MKTNTTTLKSKVSTLKNKGYKYHAVRYTTDLRLTEKTLILSDTLKCVKRHYSALPKEFGKGYTNSQKFDPPEYSLIKKEHIENLRLYGWGFYMNTALTEKDREKFKVEPNPFDILLKDDWEKDYAIMQVRHYDHTLIDHKGQHYPVAQVFNYIEAHIRDKWFDIPKLFEHLKKRKDILMLSPVEEIWYKNNDTGHDITFTFGWQPSLKDYRKLKEDPTVKANPSARWEYILIHILKCEKFMVRPPIYFKTKKEIKPKAETFTILPSGEDEDE